MNDIPVKNGISIPHHEIEISASRSGGPGGQHVNKTNSRITVRWNVQTTTALSEEQKQRVMQKLTSQLTSEGDLIIHSSASRSQEQNKRAALEQLADIIRKALHVPKKRIATRASKAAVENRLHTKSRRADIKKMRSKPIRYD